MEVFNTSYKVISKKNCNSKFILIGDLHGWINNVQIQKVINNINSKNPDIILIAGDILTESNKWLDKSTLENVKYLLSALTETGAKVVSVLGNHDTHFMSDTLLRNFKSLENIDGVYSLYNSSVDIDINDELVHIAGLTTNPIDGVTAVTNRVAKKNGIDQRPKRIVKTLEPLLDLDDRKINILLAHDPRQLRMEEVENATSEFDARVAAHIHNGYLPFSKTLNDKKYLDQDCQHYLFMGVPKLMSRNFARGIAYGSGNYYVLCTQTNDYYLVKYNYIIDDIEYIEISEEEAIEEIKANGLTPTIITGGINRYIGLPIEGSEVTSFSLKK